MPTNDWDAQLYNRFRSYRAEPFEHILERLPIGDSERIVDLGCGSGENTIELIRRAQHGSATGIDSSPAMIEAANKLRVGLDSAIRDRIEFRLGNIAGFREPAVYSIIFSN